MQRVLRIRQLPLEGPPEPGECSLLGKRFRVEPVAAMHRIVMHQDYSLIGPAEIDGFTTCALQRYGVVVSGCRCRVHPYRLMCIDEEGYDRFLLDVPQSIRGARQRYPELWSFVPALISVPPGTPFPRDASLKCAQMHPLPEPCLLDRAVPLEGLRIRAVLGAARPGSSQKEG